MKIRHRPGEKNARHKIVTSNVYNSVIFVHVFAFIRGDGMGDHWNMAGRAPELEIRDADLDHWADIRDLHGFSFGRMTGPSIDASQCAAFLAHIREPEYTLSLQQQNLLVAWIDDQLVGTAGWVAFDGRGQTARITSVCVSPLFTRLGIGRILVEASEARASHAGYYDFATRTFSPSVGFFEELGYARSSQGVQSMGVHSELPVVFMRKDPADTDSDQPRREAVVTGRPGARR